jgi:hypothetical protein
MDQSCTPTQDGFSAATWTSLLSPGVVAKTGDHADETNEPGGQRVVLKGHCQGHRGRLAMLNPIYELLEVPEAEEA